MNNKVTIKGDAIIKDVSNHTFNNFGTINNIIVEDVNASSLFNDGTIIGKVKIVKAASTPLILKGNITCEVSVQVANAKVKVDKETKVKAILVTCPQVELQVEGTINNIQIHKNATGSKLELKKDSKIDAVKIDGNLQVTGDGIENLKEDKITGSNSQVVKVVKEELKKAQQEKEAKEKQEKEQKEKAEQQKLANIQAVQQAKDKLKFINLNDVTTDLKLPTVGENGVAIAWTSNNTSVLNKNGKVTRPVASKGDAIVTLTAILTKGEAKETKEFVVTIKAKDFTDEELVDEALKSLQLNGNLNCVVDNVKLQAKDEKNIVDVTWESSNESVISNTGVVARTDQDENVKLTATLTKGSVSKTKVFDIIVKAKEKDVKEALELIKDSLKIANIANIEADINLPSSLGGATIDWKSNNETVLNNLGKVTRPQLGQKDAKVILTATISKDGESITKDFNLTVKAEQELIANNKQEFYNILKNALDNFETTVKIKVPNYNETDYPLGVLNDIVLQNPEIDYGYEGVSGKSSGYEGSQEKKLTVNITYRLSKEKMIEEKEAVKNKVQEILKSEIKEGMTDVEKELALHDYIVKNARYDVEHVNDDPVLPEDHNAYGVLVKGVGVCESYAKAMYELLNAAGVECKYVTGYSKHNEVKGGGHAWNMVKLDNECYNLDATWDDPVSDKNGTENIKKDDEWTPVYHSYFNVPDSIFNKDHIRGEFEQAHPELYPSCTATKYSYNNMDIDEYTPNGKLIEKVTTVDELDAKILEALRNKEKILMLRIKGFKMTQSELSNEVEVVADKNNIGGFKWSTGSPDDYHVYYKLTWK